MTRDDIRAEVTPKDAPFWWDITLTEDLCGKRYPVRHRHDNYRSRTWSRPTKAWATWKAKREVRRYEREQRAKYGREAFIVTSRRDLDAAV